MHNPAAVFPAVPASLTDQALVSHAGLGVLTGFLNALGFRKLCEDLFSQFAPAMAVHRPGPVRCRGFGGDDQPVHGPVQGQPEAFVYGFATMQRTLRSKVWAAAGKRNPGCHASATDPLIIDIDIDASLVLVHSDKVLAAETCRAGTGFRR